ncbi:MAG: IPT/TIG domain-containing protein [Candidatus Melainabacteria bacterium]|nr:IPT/TIG domain-containing protein [Candidatus Melainabacteria bacterium]
MVTSDLLGLEKRLLPQGLRFFRELILPVGLVLALSIGSSVMSGAAASDAGTAKNTANANDRLVVVQESRPHIARAGVWQTYRDHIHLKSGQERKQLLLTFANGADGRPKMTDLRISLAGKPFATIKDFDEAGNFSRSLNGLIGAGDTVLTSEIFGPSGARLAWKLLSEKPTVTSVQPNPYGRDDILIIQGTNFSDNKHSLKVYLAGKSAEVVSAGANQLQMKVPGYIPAGDQDLVVSVDSAKSNAFKIKARPNIYWIDITAQSPSQPVMILGRGFSKNLADNVVMVGPHKAQVTAASHTNLTFIVPEMHFPQHGMAITVITNGVSSKEHLSLDVDLRRVPNIFDAPKVVK